MPYRPPYDWGALIGFLEPRATPGVESVDDTSYRRTIAIGDAGDYASDYGAGKALQVLPGRHVVELRAGGQSLARREVFVDSQGIKTIDFTASFP